MRLMLDTNIFLDVLTQREPFYANSKAVLELCERKKAYGFLSASSVTDIFYLVRRQLHSTELAYQALGSVLEIVKVLTVTNEDVLNAYLAKAPDFEDCLLATCAKSNQCDAIVTRNKKDFQSFDIMLLSPEELLELFSANSGQVSGLSDIEVDAALRKGYEDVLNGRTKSADQVFEELQRDYEESAN